MKNIILQKNNFILKSGFSIIEVLVACTIISVSVFALMSTAQKGIELSGRALRQVQASSLLEEGAEAVKSIRNNNWTTIMNLNLDTDYYLYYNLATNTWSLNTSILTPSESIPTYPIDSTFSRRVIFSAVDRDSNDDIVESGTLDQRTKKVTVIVSWPWSGGIVSKELPFYLMDIFN